MIKYILLLPFALSCATAVQHSYMIGAEIGVDQTSYVDCTSQITKPGVKGFMNKDKLSYHKTGPAFGVHAEYGQKLDNNLYLGLNAGVARRFYSIRGNYFYKFNQQIKYIPKETYHFCAHIGHHFEPLMVYLKGGLSLMKRKSTVSYNVPGKISQTNNGIVKGAIMGIGMRFPLAENLCGAVELKHVRYQKERTNFTEGMVITQRFKSNTISVITNYVF